MMDVSENKQLDKENGTLKKTSKTRSLPKRRRSRNVNQPSGGAYGNSSG